jgi:hypothetical protein
LFLAGRKPAFSLAVNATDDPALVGKHPPSPIVLAITPEEGINTSIGATTLTGGAMGRRKKPARIVDIDRFIADATEIHSTVIGYSHRPRPQCEHWTRFISRC